MMFRDLRLNKTGETASVDLLDSTHLAQVLALQDETRTALPEAEKMFVLPQTRDYFERLLNRENGVMLGVRTKGQMIAQMAVMGSITMNEAIIRKAITRNAVSFHHAEPADSVVVAKSMMVHPDWRGNDLSRYMLEAALDMPMVRKADHIFAQVSVENTRSWELFLRHGFGIVAAAIDPVDSRPRFVMQKPALGLDIRPTASADNIDAKADFDTIMRLTEVEKLIGLLDELDQTRLAFNTNNNLAGAWNEPPTRVREA